MSEPLRHTSTTRRTSTMAIVSLVSGLLGWTLLPLIGSLVAIATGHVARAEIRRGPPGLEGDRLEGDGLAVAGLVLGYAALAIAVATVIAIVVFLGGLAAFFALASHWS